MSQYPRFEQINRPRFEDRFHQLEQNSQPLGEAYAGAFPGMPGSPEQRQGGGGGSTAGMSIIGKTGQQFEDKLHSFEEQLPGNPWSIMPEGWGDQIRDWTRQAKTPMKMMRQNGGADMRGGSDGKKS